MSTICTWGTPLPETDRVAVDADTTRTFDGQWGEFLVELAFAPREPTNQEYSAAVSRFVREFSIEHPLIEIRYVEAIRGSNQIKIQYISHENSPVIAAIVAAVIAILAVILANPWAIAIIAVAIVSAVLLYKRFKPTEFQCPICGAKYENYETLVAHMEYEHPGAPIPEKTVDIPNWLPHILLAGAVIAVIVVVGPPLARKLSGEKR